MMKRFALVVFLWLFVACTPNAIAPTPQAESRPTVIATALGAPTPTAVPPTQEPQPIPPPEPETPTPAPEPEAGRRFDIFLPFAHEEGNTVSLTGLVRQGDGWQIAGVRYPLGISSTDSD